MESKINTDGARTSASSPSVFPHLACVVVLRVQQQTELRQELGPVLQLSLGGDGGDEDACHREGVKRRRPVTRKGTKKTPARVTDGGDVCYSSITRKQEL